MSLTAPSAAVQSFNADFYVMAATVIPVLFLAFAVQGDAFSRMLRTGFRDDDEKFDTLLSTFVTAARGLFRLAVLFVAGFILLFAGAGEIAAILSIYNRSGDAIAGRTVLLAVVMLTCFVTAWPLFRPLVDRGKSGEGSQRDGRS